MPLPRLTPAVKCYCVDCSQWCCFKGVGALKICFLNRYICILGVVSSSFFIILGDCEGAARLEDPTLCF